MLFLLLAGVALLAASCNDKKTDYPKTVTDVDGNVYNTILMGKQLWMAENLRTTHFADGTEIPEGTEYDAKNPFRYVPGNDPAMVERYGYYYNWAAAVKGGEHSMERVQGVCPDGWHMPSRTEYEILVNYVGHQPECLFDGDRHHVAKALASQGDWEASSEPGTPGNNPAANNASGMNIQPAGYFKKDANLIGTIAYLWTSTDYTTESGEVSPTTTHTLNLYPGRADVATNGAWTQASAFSVRCVMDQE